MHDDITPWRNTRDLYTQFARIDEVPEALRRLLEMYGTAFDSTSWYWLTTRGRGKGLFVKKVPIWQTSKKMPAEKSRPYPRHRGQSALFGDDVCFSP